MRSSLSLSQLLAAPILALMLAIPASAEPSPSGPPAAAGPSTTAPGTASPTGQASPSSPGTSATIPSVTPATSGQNAPPATSPSAPATQGTAGDGGQNGAASSGETNGSPAEPGAATATPSPAPEAPKSSIVINIDKASQEMTVFVDGVELYSWPVSTGKNGYSTPSGTYTASSMNKIWYSKQWDNAPMPHAIFFTKEGHAIHGTLEEKRLGKPASHGCVRLSRANAATLYALVEANGLAQTQVVLTGTTPGGEGPKVASPNKWPEYGYGVPPWFGPGYPYREPPRRRRGLFGRWFDPYGAQGYYVPPRDRYRPRY